MDPLRTCSRCGIQKPTSEFALRSSTAKGLVPRAWCKACDVPQSTEKSAEASRIKKMRQRYDLSVERFNEMMQEQHGLCAICFADIREAPYIDHNHETGAVRSLLCFHCNVGLGHFKDDIDRLRSAVQYLEEHYVYTEHAGEVVTHG